VKVNPTPLSGLRYGLLAGALLTLGYAGAASAQRASKLTIGNEISDEITASNRINYNDGSYSKLYRFKATPGEVVVFRSSGELNAGLALYVNDKLVARSSRNGEDNDHILSFRIQSKDKHLLAVNGKNREALGTFTLNSKQLNLEDIQVLTPDTPAITSWTDGSQELQLQIEQSAHYQIDMESDEIDSVLKLTGNGLELEDDDGGEGLNARLFVHLKPGTYTLNPSGYHSSEEDITSGIYTLAVKTFPVPAELNNEGRLPLDGTVFTGLFEGQDRTYTLQLEQTQWVTIDLRSEMFDAYLSLKGKNIERENDDGGEGLNARLSVVLDPGTYEIIAQAARPGTGLFELSATARDVPPAKRLTLGQPTQAQLQANSSGERYTFTVNNPGRYVIEMTSADIDSHLRLYRGSEQIAEDDDGGNGVNARIDAELSRGSYLIEASAYSSDESGNYQIEVRRR